jgi:hypothetical protein
MHYSCPESNYFSTNCACHLRCKDSTCQNAIDLCKKHRSLYSCKYVLIRVGNKVATLKREISALEKQLFSIEEFKSKQYNSETILTNIRPKTTFKDFTISDNEVLGTVAKINAQLQVRFHLISVSI